MAAYTGQKIIFAEKLSHEYLHVEMVDGDKIKITPGGELLTYGQPPALWNFVYENKNPGINIGVHHKDTAGLPELYPNVAGAPGIVEEDYDY